MRIAFVDCETTGLYADAGHEAWEVALVVVPDGPGDRVGHWVKGDAVAVEWQLPVDVSKADPMSLSMNGWYDRSVQHEKGLDGEQVEQGITYSGMLPKGLTAHEQFARDFMALVHGAALVGAVPSFDERFLSKALRKGGGVPCWHYQPVDVETLAAGWLLGQAEVRQVPDPANRVGLDDERAWLEEVEAFRRLPWDSEALSRAVGVDPARFDRHTAMGDALWARAVWDVIMQPPAAAG